MTWMIAYVSLGWVFRAAMLPTVLRRQFTPGASLAWLTIVFLHPYMGMALYLLVGETRLGRGRNARHKQLLNTYRALPFQVVSSVTEDMQNTDWKAIALQAQHVGRLPVIGGNQVEFIDQSTAMIDRLAADIDAATSQVHLLYYMVANDASGKRIADAVMAAQKRGVECRMLVDSFASSAFLARGGLAGELKAHGVKVAEAMPRSIFRRRDLRNHRKLGIIDGKIAFAGSQNLVNADYGGRKGAPWYDVTGRYTGSIVNEFAAIFAEDWAFETDEMLAVNTAAHTDGASPGIAMQVVPTGPAEPSESYRRVFLGGIQAARKRLVLTTPYFVPDDPTLVALLMAADRGVDVTLILPEVPDHIFTAVAGRAHYANLLRAGVSIYLYRPGLVHTKSATVDDVVAIFGSANLDVRSFNLNFELTTLLYGREVVERLRAIQLNYLKDARRLDANEWTNRAVIKQYAESAVALVSPLL